MKWSDFWKRLFNNGRNAISVFVGTVLIAVITITASLLTACSEAANGGETPMNSEADIKELTITVNSGDYTVAFKSDKAATVVIPHTESIPNQVTAKSIALSENATGLQSGDALSVTANRISITITSEDQNTQNTYAINLISSKISLTASQISVIDGTAQDGSTKLPSNFMIFDIMTTDSAGEKIPVEFLLVKDGDDEPSSLDAFRKAVAVTLIGGTYDLVMTHKSAILPSGATSVYLSHDSAGRYPLDPNTAYKLYEAQPDSDDSSPKSLGSFTTGTYATYTGDLRKHIEDPGTAGNSGRFYTENEQFFVLTSLWGQAEGLNDGFSFMRNSNTITSEGNDITQNSSLLRDFDTFLGQAEKPFPFFHAILGGEQFFEQAGTTISTDLQFAQSGGITLYEVWDPVIAGLSPADGAASSSVTPVLSWNAVSGAGKYRLQGALSLDTVTAAPGRGTYSANIYLVNTACRWGNTLLAGEGP